MGSILRDTIIVFDWVLKVGEGVTTSEREGMGERTVMVAAVRGETGVVTWQMGEVNSEHLDLVMKDRSN